MFGTLFVSTRVTAVPDLGGRRAMHRIPDQIWALSPLLFAAGFALLYSKEIATRIGGGFIIAVALGIARDPGDADNWYLAVFLAVVGLIVLSVFRPRWLRFSDNNCEETSKPDRNS